MQGSRALPNADRPAGGRPALAASTPAGRLAKLRSGLGAPLYANALYLWLNALGTALAGFVFWTLVTRLYGADDVGRGSAALSALALLAMFSHLGLGLGLIRLLPDAGADGPRLVNAALTASALVAAVLTVTFLAGLSLWAPGLDFLRGQPLHAVAYTAFAVAATASYVQTNTFVAVLKAKYVLAQAAAVQLGRLVLLAVMAATSSAFGIVAAGGTALMLGAALGLLLLVKAMPGYRAGVIIDRPAVSRLLPFSVGNYMADSLLVLPSLALPLAVILSLGSADAAYFYIPWFLGHLVIMSSSHLGLSLFAAGANDPDGLRLLSRNAVVAGLAIASTGALCALLLGRQLLSLAFGGDYASEGAALLRLVTLAALPAAVVNAYLGALRVGRRVRELVAIAALISVSTLASSLALLPVAGVEGAGIGLGLGQGLGLAVVTVRLLTATEGTMPQRVRWLLGAGINGAGPARGGAMQSQRNGGVAAAGRGAARWNIAGKRPRVAALVCALNEEESLPHVLPRIPGWVDEVVLVDGRSADATVQTAMELRPDVRVVHQPGRGKGDALKCGIELADGDIIVTLDADGSTDPGDMARFVEPLLRGYDFVKGSRFALSRPAGKPRHRIVGNRIIVAVYNALFGTNYTDLCSGYNAFWKHAIAGVDLTGWSDQEEPLLNARVKKAGLKVLEVGHHDSGRIGGETKQPSLRQGSGAIRTLLKEWLRD